MQVAVGDVGQGHGAAVGARDVVAGGGHALLDGVGVQPRQDAVVLGRAEVERDDGVRQDGAFRVDIHARAQYKQRAESIEMVRPAVQEFMPGLVFEDELVKVYADYVDHIPREIMHCFGFRIEAAGKVLAFSGDTKPCDAMLRLADNADLLIHECTFPEEALEFRRKTNIGTYAHTSPTELGKLATRAGVKSLVATHFGHFDTTSPVVKRYLAKHMPIELVGPAFMESVVRDIRKHYFGPLAMAHDLMRIDL